MKTIDLLIITPYRADGSDIDAITTFVENAVEAGQLPRQAKTRHARGVAQALDILVREKFRVIWFSNYEGLERGLGGGITEIWEQAENQRLFDGARLRFGNIIRGAW